MSLADRLQQVLENIARAAEKSGRRPEDVQLVAVTKTMPVPVIKEAIGLGVTRIGENKVQEIREKYDQIDEDVEWHMIGHLQSNKVKYILDKVALIHSLDRMSLAWELEKKAAKKGVQVPVLVQVNVAEEESKFGLRVPEVLPFLEKLADFPHIAVKGLMTMAPYVSDPEQTRPVFSGLRELRDKIAAQKYEHVRMEILSMGMTNDYQVAIEEGATMVRIGSAIFGERRYT
ncbi:MAG: YggS family pyridoxal phosphate-dependent enzyme [Thermoanaerobacteraceae bacterium]|nr:YggS family pyridoxal phosphate-dependent enzyme [Thermoanaerobacteraceae bacterium]